jgi:hypothetical protein
MLLLKYSVLGRDPNGMLLIDSRIASAVTPPATMPCPPEFASALNMPPEPVGGAGKLGVSESDLYVDSIDPQEYAQNLSDVSSTNKLLSLSLGISALLGNSASVSGTAGYLQQTQKLLQSIERNPLAIGFRGGQKFGWLLGSPFKIQDGEPAFIHVPARQSFSVSFVAPVWLDHVTICANAWWIDNSGTISRSITVEDPQHKVLLPVDFSAISTAVNYFITGQRVPIVYEKDKQPSAWILQSGSSTDQTLLIVGPDLWRNPQVFVNSTKADTVDLLPDMNGLLAHFKNFPTVQTLSLAPLTVVTSFGESTVGQSVTILPPENKSASGPSATLASGFVVGGTPNEPLSFAVDPKSMPGNYAGFVLKVRQTNNAADWTTVDTTNFWRSNDQKTLYFPIIPAPAAFTQPMSLTVDLRLKPNAFDDPINLLTQLDAADRTVVYFPKEGQENPVLATTQPINFDPKTQLPTPAIISLTPTTTTGMTVTMQNLYDAYPGLQDSIKNGTAMLVLQDTTANNSAQLPLGASTIDTSFSVSLTGVKLSQLPLGNYNSLKVTFKATSANMPNSISVSLPPSASASQPPQPLQVTSK